jgi:hypothetical protein
MHLLQGFSYLASRNAKEPLTYSRIARKSLSHTGLSQVLVAENVRGFYCLTHFIQNPATEVDINTFGNLFACGNIYALQSIDCGQ